VPRDPIDPYTAAPRSLRACAKASGSGGTHRRLQPDRAAAMAELPPELGSRFKLEQGGEAVFDCYAQELPALDHTLGYGQAQTVGAITCASEPSAMTCADGSTGHYFRISREAYEVG